MAWPTTNRHEPWRCATAEHSAARAGSSEHVPLRAPGSGGRMAAALNLHARDRQPPARADHHVHARTTSRLTSTPSISIARTPRLCKLTCQAHAHALNVRILSPHMIDLISVSKIF